MKPSSLTESRRNPFSLSFNEALQGQDFLGEIRSSAEEKIRANLLQSCTGPAKVLLASANFALQRGQLVATFPKTGAKAHTLMKSGNAIKAVATTSKGHTTEIATLIKGGRLAGTGALAAGLVVVEAAHIISDHDNAKKLKKIVKDTTRLVHFQESELVAELEAIYRQAKEIAYQQSTELSEQDQSQIAAMSQSLFKLRAQWRHNFSHRLSEIEKAKAGWWTQALRWQRDSSHSKAVEKKSDEVNHPMEMLRLMHFSLQLQFGLSQLTGRSTAFREATMPDEVQEWFDLAAYARHRGTEITGGKLNENFENFISGVNNLARFWQTFTAPTPSEQEGEPQTTTSAQYGKAHNISPAKARKILEQGLEQGLYTRKKSGRSYVYTSTTS